MATVDVGAATKHFSPEDSWHGRIEEGGIFTPEAGRYHLVIGLFCPFAHRANLVRHLKSLDEIIGLSVVKPYPKGDAGGYPGWRYLYKGDEYPGATEDPLYGHEYLHQLYFKVDPHYKGRYSVPVLWDKKLNTIVSNESAEILRWLPTAFISVLGSSKAGPDLYPAELRENIDHITEWMQRDLNTGVYKAGFAYDEQTYAKNVLVVFAALNKLEKTIAKNGGPFILGSRLTELDIRAYATMVRFDTVYVQHFKCNLGTIRSHYPVTNNWLKNLYHNIAKFRETTDSKHIKENYTKSHYDINPLAITPVGPVPHVEQGVQDFATLRLGGIELPDIAELEAKL